MSEPMTRAEFARLLGFLWAGNGTREDQDSLLAEFDRLTAALARAEAVRGAAMGLYDDAIDAWNAEINRRRAAEVRAEKAEAALARQVESAYLEGVQDTANTLTGDSIAETWALDLWEESEARALLAPRPAPTAEEGR